MCSCVRKACCCAELLEIVQTASWSLWCMGWIALGFDRSSRRGGETERSTGWLTVSLVVVVMATNVEFATLGLLVLEVIIISVAGG